MTNKEVKLSVNNLKISFRTDAGKVQAVRNISFDLYEGKACFLKSGAAASFVFRDGALFRIRSRTIPLGLLRIVDSEEASFDVRAGDVMVLLSDGVLGESEDGSWLKDVLGAGGDGETVARRIVETAMRRATSDDDKTAVVLRVFSAKEI